MTRHVVFALLAAIACAFGNGCQRDKSPPPLAPDQDRQLQEQIEKAGQAEGGAPRRGE